MKHKVDVADAMVRMNRGHEGLNEIKKLSTKKDPRELEMPGPYDKFMFKIKKFLGVKYANSQN